MSRNKVITADATAGLVLAGTLATTGFVGAGFPEDPLKSRHGRRIQLPETYQAPTAMSTSPPAHANPDPLRIGDGSNTMTSALDSGHRGPVNNATFANPRLVYTPTPRAEGVLDGAWWPHTRVLSEELPPLLAAVARRFGPVAKISLNTTAWDATPQDITCGDGAVQVAWYRACDADTIRLLGNEHWHLDMLVIPPDTATDTAAAALSGVTLGHSVAALHATLTRGDHIPGPCLTLTTVQ